LLTASAGFARHPSDASRSGSLCLTSRRFYSVTGEKRLRSL